MDDYDSLSPYQQLLIAIEAVEHERGFIDMDTMCQAELFSRYWALQRKHKLQAISMARTMKKDHQLIGKEDNSKSTNLKVRALQSADAFRDFFNSCGVPVMDMMI